MEYTYISLFMLLLVTVLDFFFGTKLVTRKDFWIFWIFMVIMFLIINGYLTWRPVLVYDNYYNLNFRLFTVPVEDLFFGYSLINLNLIIWELSTKKLIKK